MMAKLTSGKFCTHDLYCAAAWALHGCETSEIHHVVPAKAGTHNHLVEWLCSVGVATSSKGELREYGSPTFAGTTLSVNLNALDLVVQAAANAGTGSAVTDLIFSIAKREVTFFSATALMSFL